MGSCPGQSTSLVTFIHVTDSTHKWQFSELETMKLGQAMYGEHEVGHMYTKTF